MPSSDRRHGGARPGSGPVRRRLTLSYGAAVLLRELTRSRLGRRDVSETDLVATLESIIAAAANARLAELEARSDAE